MLVPTDCASSTWVYKYRIVYLSRIARDPVIVSRWIHGNAAQCNCSNSRIKLWENTPSNIGNSNMARDPLARVADAWNSIGRFFAAEQGAHGHLDSKPLACTYALTGLGQINCSGCKKLKPDRRPVMKLLASGLDLFRLMKVQIRMAGVNRHARLIGIPTIRRFVRSRAG